MSDFSPPSAVELRHLRYFIAVAAHGSFNRAAEVLHLTQPALSRQVKDLEEEIGAPLVVRGTNYVTLTPTGETFYEDARDVLARADQAVERARGERRNESVRVGYMPTAAAGIMAAALKKFQAAAPRVRVDLSEITVGEMKKRAKAGRLDLLILPERETQDLPGFQWILLRKIAFVAVMPATHPLARLKKISPARLRDVSLIGFDKEAFPSYSTHVRDSLRPFGVTPRFVALINDGTASVMAALEANHAVAVVSDSAEDIMPRNMVARPFSPSLANSNIVMGFSETQPNRHAATFARFLREEAEQSRPAKKAGNTKAF